MVRQSPGWAHADLGRSREKKGKEYSRRTRSEEGGIIGRPGRDHPTENAGKLSIVHVDCANDARAERDEAK